MDSDSDEDDQSREDFKELPASSIRHTSLINYLSDYRDAKINLCPIYQRGPVWSTQRKKNFIHQLFRRKMTIPPIQLNDLEEHTNVIDGKQRLLAVFDYMNNEYCLKDKKYYSKGPAVLDKIERRKFDNCVLGAIVYEQLDEDDEIDIFQNIQNGLPLQSGEKLSASNDPIAIFIRNKICKSNDDDPDIFNKQKWKRSNKTRFLFIMILSMIDPKGIINLTGRALAQKSNKITLDEIQEKEKDILTCIERLVAMKKMFTVKYETLTTLDIIVLGHYMYLYLHRNLNLTVWLNDALKIKSLTKRSNDNLNQKNITQLKKKWNGLYS